MGRGLSPLQRRILQLAHDNRTAGRSRRGTPDVYAAEVYAEVYGFQPLPGADVRNPARQTFSREQIGAQEYHAAAASISRALRRLADRGLLTRHGGAGAGAGARLTKAGHEEAAALLTEGAAPMGRSKPNKPRRTRPDRVSTQDAERLVVDLLTRTEMAVEQICRTAVDTGITFQVSDIADAVERALPPECHTEKDWNGKRREVIEHMAQKILTREAYEDTAPH